MELSCHCANVKISVRETHELLECNCSICRRYMPLWGYYQPNEPEIEIGSAGIEAYSWGDEEIDFMHCSRCACITHYKTKPGQPRPKIAINFRMSQESIQHIPIRHFNGAEEL